MANAKDAQHAVAARAVLELHRCGEVLHVTPQVMIEFRNVATRPVTVNGLGLSTVDTEALAATFEARFPLLTGRKQRCQDAIRAASFVVLRPDTYHDPIRAVSFVIFGPDTFVLSLCSVRGSRTIRCSRQRVEEEEKHHE
jgi:hypothetical protein